MKKHILILTLLSFTSLVALAQEKGQISGTIVDAENGETIIGASVGITGTTKGDATDLDGNFTIRNLDSGLYSITVSYISYQTQTITDINVVSGETTKLDIALNSDVTNLDEITVTAEAILNNEAGLLRQRQKSIAFSDAISAEAISRSGSGDAAGALKKVVGASVVGGKYVYIRGLGDRYTSSHLNGTELPSADPNRKAFQLDIFPSSLLENIVTLKTFTPDKPGNFSGGLVDVNTKDFPTERLFQVSTSIGYITNTTFEDVLLSERSDTDWLGYDDGGRSIPEFAVNYLNNPNNENFPRANDGENDPQIAQELDLLAKSFNSDFEPDPINAYLNHSYGVTLGNKVSLFGKELGYIASLTYGESFDSYNNGVNAGYELIGSPSDATGLTANFDYDDERGSRTVDIGGLINFAYKLSSNHKIKTTFIATQSGAQSGRLLNGFDQDFEGSDLSNRVVEFTERSLRSGQLGGKHSFPKLVNAVVEWKTAYTKNTQDEPNRRLAVTQSEERVLAGNDTTIYSFPNGLKFPLRFYRELEEESYNASVDVSIPFVSFNGGKGYFKLG
ncbi:MAG: carboxypeptidase-like regulatory domain-containing protein, partial [Balneola sp.]